MIPVFQTKFGSLDDPPDEWGNCWAACVASILHINLEDVPSIGDQKKRWDECWGRMQTFVSGYGFHMIQLKWPEEEVPALPFYCIAVVPSDTLPDSLHAVIYRDGVCVHDPNSRAPRKNKNTPIGYEVFVPIDPGRMQLMERG